MDGKTFMATSYKIQFRNANSAVRLGNDSFYSGVGDLAGHVHKPTDAAKKLATPNSK